MSYNTRECKFVEVAFHVIDLRGIGLEEFLSFWSFARRRHMLSENQMVLLSSVCATSAQQQRLESY